MHYFAGFASAGAAAFGAAIESVLGAAVVVAFFFDLVDLVFFDFGGVDASVFAGVAGVAAVAGVALAAGVARGAGAVGAGVWATAVSANVLTNRAERSLLILFSSSGCSERVDTLFACRRPKRAMRRCG